MCSRIVSRIFVISIVLNYGEVLLPIGLQTVTRVLVSDEENSVIQRPAGMNIYMQGNVTKGCVSIKVYNISLERIRALRLVQVVRGLLRLSVFGHDTGAVCGGHGGPGQPWLSVLREHCTLFWRDEVFYIPYFSM